MTWQRSVVQVHSGLPDSMKSFILTILTIFSFSSIASDSHPLIGTHWWADGSIISIINCDNRLCGVMEHIFTEDDSDPMTILDKNNPSNLLKTRPLIGVRLIDSFSLNPTKGVYKDGMLYDPRSGKSYKGKIQLLDKFTLKVEGCIAFLCQGVLWDALEVSYNDDGSRSALLLRDKK